MGRASRLAVRRAGREAAPQPTRMRRPPGIVRIVCRCLNCARTIRRQHRQHDADRAMTIQSFGLRARDPTTFCPGTRGTRSAPGCADRRRIADTHCADECLLGGSGAARPPECSPETARAPARVPGRTTDVLDHRHAGLAADVRGSSWNQVAGGTVYREDALAHSRGFSNSSSATGRARSEARLSRSHTRVADAQRRAGPHRPVGSSTSEAAITAPHDASSQFHRPNSSSAASRIRTIICSPESVIQWLTKPVMRAPPV